MYAKTPKTIISPNCNVVENSAQVVDVFHSFKTKYFKVLIFTFNSYGDVNCAIGLQICYYLQLSLLVCYLSVIMLCHIHIVISHLIVMTTSYKCAIGLQICYNLQ